MIFWDTSALIHLLIDQGRSGEMARLYAGDAAIAAWWGVSVEAASAIERLKREGDLSADEEARAYRKLLKLSMEWHEAEPSNAVRDLARQLLARHAIRGADALQLAAALTLRELDPDNFRFAAIDSQLARAALREGLFVVP